MTPRQDDDTDAEIYDRGTAPGADFFGSPGLQPAEPFRPVMYRFVNAPGAAVPAPSLTANEIEWRRLVTEIVTEFRREHGGANPSFRAFALRQGGGDKSAVATWTSRVKRHPASIDPALKWPQGEAVAAHARTMHASVG